MTTKPKRGGHRPGAGRPPEMNRGRNVNLYLSAEVVAALDEAAAKARISRSRAAQVAIAAGLARLD